MPIMDEYDEYSQGMVGSLHVNKVEWQVSPCMEPCSSLIKHQRLRVPADD